MLGKVSLASCHSKHPPAGESSLGPVCGPAGPRPPLGGSGLRGYSPGPLDPCQPPPGLLPRQRVELTATSRLCVQLGTVWHSAVHLQCEVIVLIGVSSSCHDLPLVALHTPPGFAVSLSPTTFLFSGRKDSVFFFFFSSIEHMHFFCSKISDV